MTVTNLPMFGPADAGLPAQSWDEVEATAAASRPRCSECGHRVRSRESTEDEIGPCCAAKIGRAVVRARRKAEAAARSVA